MKEATAAMRFLCLFFLDCYVWCLPCKQTNDPYLDRLEELFLETFGRPNLAPHPHLQYLLGKVRSTASKTWKLSVFRLNIRIELTVHQQCNNGRHLKVIKRQIGKKLTRANPTLILLCSRFGEFFFVAVQNAIHFLLDIENWTKTWNFMLIILF